MTASIEQCVAGRHKQELNALAENLALGLGIKQAAATRQEPNPLSAGQIALSQPEANAILRQIAELENVKMTEAGPLPSGGVFPNPTIEIARNIAAARAVKSCGQR